MNEGRCDERLKARVEESTRLYTRLIDERFASVMGECVIVNILEEGFESTTD